MVRLYSNLLMALFVALILFVPGLAESRGLLQPKSDNDSKTNEVKVVGGVEQIRDLVADEFGEDHTMMDVARCESSFRQFDGSGEALRNPRSGAVGVFQILEGLHEEPAEKLGIDIFTAEGNIAYARKLYDSFGLSPWSPSSLCWDDGSLSATNPDGKPEAKEESTRVPVKVRDDGELRLLHSDKKPEQKQQKQETQESAVKLPITKKLVSGVRDPQVRKLQKLLNDIGYELSESGPGSPGKETNFFGAKTRSAVKEFQCDQDIVCSGGRYSTGYGLVGKETRLALKEVAQRRDAGKFRFNGVRVRDHDSGSSKKEFDSLTSADRAGEQELTSRINRLQQQVITLKNQID